MMFAAGRQALLRAAKQQPSVESKPIPPFLVKKNLIVISILAPEKCIAFKKILQI